MTTTLLLIRHGQTEWNANGRWQGHTDIPLNDAGISQAQALARRLADWPVQTLYSSDLKRAAMTAEILGQSLNLQPIFDPAWRERDVGDFGGLTKAEVKAQFPKVWADMRNGIVNPPGGENYLALYERATAVYHQLLAQHNGEMVAVVSHGGTLYAVISHVLGIGAGNYGRFTLRGNTGLSIIEVGQHGPRLTLLNDTGHLES